MAAYVIVLVLGYPLRVAFAVAIVLGQDGEFSFILAHLGQHLKILPEAATNALVAASILSISLNPLLYRLVDQAVAWSGRRALERSRATVSREEGNKGSPDNSGTEKRPPNAGEHRAVVIGYGPVGQTLSRLLCDNEIEPTIVEMNMETVKRLRSEGIQAIYGDASHSGTLAAAGIRHAHSLILGASGLRNAKEIIRLAREQNPKIRVLVRTSYLREVEGLSQAGADNVFASEGEVALAMTETLLKQLGATADQIDREKDRVREDLFRSIGRKPTA